MDMHSADYQLAKLLGLHLAKDIAENNAGARVHTWILSWVKLFSVMVLWLLLLVLILICQSNTHCFNSFSASQTILPESDGAIGGYLAESGLMLQLVKDVPTLVSKNIDNILIEAFTLLGISDWNSLFWIFHPGGTAILNQVRLKLGLKQEKLRASRHVLSEYGNLSSACVLFIMDKMRKKSSEEGKETSGEGLEWGMLFGFGPGLTIESVVLRSTPYIATH